MVGERRVQIGIQGSSPHLLDDFPVVGKAADLMLGKNQLVIDLDIENAPLATHQLSIDAEFSL
jgi:hypothetical protein